MSRSDRSDVRNARRPREEAVYVVDRLTRAQVVLVRDDDAAVVRVGRGRFEAAEEGGQLREGVVVRVPISAAGRAEWGRAVVDEEETERRLEEARARLERLRERDPGGDLVL
jgi:hypothetical protein